MGIDVDRAHRIAFGIGTGVTAVAGGLVATYYPFQPYVGLEFVIIMYAGVVLGGMGSMLGAFWGGMTIGLVQQLSSLVLSAQLQNVRHLRRLSADRAAAAARLVRPQRGEDLTHGHGRAATDSRRSIAYRGHWRCCALGSHAGQQQYYQLMLTLVPIWAVMGLSWNLLSGYTGLVSFGHAAFFGLGAYTVTIAAGALRCDALVRHSRWACWSALLPALRHRVPDVPPAGALFRAGDARLPAGAAVSLRVARLPGGGAADEARGAGLVHAVRRLPRATSRSRSACWWSRC